MPTTTSFDFGDIVLVPFPFTDQIGTKKRPAVVVSSALYNQKRSDIILMVVSGQLRPGTAFGELEIAHWKEASLHRPSLVKPVIATFKRDLVTRKLGRLEEDDRGNLRNFLNRVLGP